MNDISAVVVTENAQDMKIQDIAPNILAILGLGVPEDMDGKVKREIFQTGFLKEVKFSSVKADEQRLKHDYSPEESEAIQKRPGELGYID